MTLRSASILCDTPLPVENHDDAEGSDEPPGRSTTPDPIRLGTSLPSDSEGVTSPLGFLAGIAIALLTLAVPLASVLADRHELTPTGSPSTSQR